MQKKLETGASSTTDQLRPAQSRVWKLLPTKSFVPLQEQFKDLNIMKGAQINLHMNCAFGTTHLIKHIYISKSTTVQWTPEPSGTGRKVKSGVYSISGKTATTWPCCSKCSYKDCAQGIAEQLGIKLTHPHLTTHSPNTLVLLNF